MRSYDNGDACVFDVSRRIFAKGDVATPRGVVTKELLHEVFTIVRPEDCIPVGINRPKLSLAMAALESLQNIGGVERPDLFQSIAPTSAKFSMLVYGERLAKQMPKVEALLRRDPHSRQAVVTVWHKGLLDDEEAGSNHCALTLQFLLRYDRLDMSVSMRSNDAFWGLTYDLPQFAQVQATLAGVLDVEVGMLVWHAASMHLYERHWPVIEQFTCPPILPNAEYGGIVRNLNGVSGNSWAEAAARARAILDGVKPHDATMTERWMWEQIFPHVSWQYALAKDVVSA
jgi:thymidylate synthase